MNPAPSSPAPARRSYARWIVAGLLLLFAPVVIIGVGVWSMLSLDRNAAALKREVMQATHSDWHTKVQMSVGCVTLGALRTGLRFVQHENIADARLALRAVRHASVGVYERDHRDDSADATALLAETDRTMQEHGWTRLVGVVEHGQQVLIYTSDKGVHGDRIDLCLAVVDGRELVVVSTQIDAGDLAELVNKHAPGGLHAKFAKLNL